MTAQIYVFQINGTQITPTDPVVSTPWTTKEIAEAAAQTYANQLLDWWHTIWPEDPGPYVDVIVDTLHLDENGDPVRFGIQPDENDGHPQPVNLTGYFTIDWDGMEWTPFIF